MDVSLGSLKDDVLIDEENLIRPRGYAHYDSEVCPGWLKGILSPSVEIGMASTKGIAAECCKPNRQSKTEET